MKKKREEERPPVEEKVLDVNATMQGTLRFDDPVNLRISGKFEGNLDTKGMLMIGRKAEIKAEIKGESISISGLVNGTIKATRIVKLESTARVNGDIETPKLEVSEGAVLNGRIKMFAGEADVDISRSDWMTMAQLAKYLEVENSKINDWVTGGLLPATREGGEWLFERSRVDQWIAEGKVRV
ncbi:MAG: polymer-forming cytoskeletal protein [Candidatus Omnitrophota bacterium]